MEGKNKVALTFAFYQGDQLVRRETVAQDIIKVGKDPKSHLRVDDDQASRMHAVIEVQDDVTLIDLGNEAGTLVNGARVNKCKLNAGDQIQIGTTLIVLEKVEQAAAVAAAMPAGGGELAMGSAPGNVAAGGRAAGAPNVPPPAFGGGSPFAGAQAANPFAVASPFAASPFGPMGGRSGGVPDNAPEGTYEYSLVKSGPDVPSDETDSPASSVEVRVLWGRNLLHVAHVPHGKSFYVGEDDSGGKNKAFKVDYFVPADKLGTSRAPIVIGGHMGAAAVILPRSVGVLEMPGQPKMTLHEAIQGGRVQPCAEVQGAHQVPLNQGTHLRMEVGDIVFEVNAVAAGRKVAAAFTLAALGGGALLYVLGSFVGHAGLLAAMAMFMPPLGDTAEDSISDDQRYLIQQYLDAAAEKELEEKETEQIAEEEADNKEGGTGTRAKGEEGSMGNPNSTLTGNRYGVAGPQDNPDPHIARQAALRDAAEFGMIGLLNAGAGGDPDAPTAEWGRDDSLGTDPLSARGNMWGDSIGESFGAGGLGLTGIGEGGGGRGEGIGLGSIGTIGHGAGTGTGQGFGSGHGRLGRGHRAAPPNVRMGQTNVSGRLPPEVIQRIVRQNFGRFRLCYENGLRNNPNLQGRVSVSFVISRDGTVSQVSGGGDIPDGGVVSCVVRAFYGLNFPQPEGGIVTVSYPIVFTPGG
jgi:FHA domain-containing protein